MRRCNVFLCVLSPVQSIGSLLGAPHREIAAEEDSLWGQLGADLPTLSDGKVRVHSEEERRREGKE